jgi:hypothetical protein
MRSHLFTVFEMESETKSAIDFGHPGPKGGFCLGSAVDSLWRDKSAVAKAVLADKRTGI